MKPTSSSVEDARKSSDTLYAGFLLANDAKTAHSCSMKIIEAIRHHATEQGLTEAAALKKGREAKSLGFMAKNLEVCANACHISSTQSKFRKSYAPLTLRRD